MQDRRTRRVLKTRSALMGAAVRVVSERGTTAVSVSDLSDAADLSRQMVYLQFGDRDGLLVATATDLAERELMPQIRDGDAPVYVRMLATARHFARYRAFYRPLLIGSCAFAASRELNRLFASLVTAPGLREAFGDLDVATARDLTALVTGGIGAIVNEWLVEADDPLDPEALAQRLLRVSAVLLPGRFVQEGQGR